MEYQVVDEVARKEACENLKKIVKSIKAIRIQYYLIFGKISAKDKEKYKNLEASLEQIAQKNGLEDLKTILMQEVNARYNGQDLPNIDSDVLLEANDILQACYGAIDAEQDALGKGKITQALRCQNQLQKYIELLNPEQKQEIINYKREKFAELVKSREQVENQLETWDKNFKNMYKINDVVERENVKKIIEELQVS